MSGTQSRGGIGDPAIEETLRLYHAWLGYLLERLGEETVRVSVGDIRKALEGLSVSVNREGETYVITLLREKSREPDTESRPENASPPGAKEVDGSHDG